MWVDGILEVNALAQTEGGVVATSGNNWYIGYMPGFYDSFSEYPDVGTKFGKFAQYNKILTTREVQNIYVKEQPQYNTALIEGVYFPYSRPSPLLYEFNCLTDTSLRGEETENFNADPTFTIDHYDGQSFAGIA